MDESYCTGTAAMVVDKMTQEFMVICLCAEWCGACREYRPGFLELAAQFPDARFRWLDIEDEADAVGELDVENFPTLFIQRGEWVMFYGTMLPHLTHLRRTLETFRELSPQACRDYVESSSERRAWQVDPDLHRLGLLRE